MSTIGNFLTPEYRDRVQAWINHFRDPDELLIALTRIDHFDDELGEILDDAELNPFPILDDTHYTSMLDLMNMAAAVKFFCIVLADVMYLNEIDQWDYAHNNPGHDPMCKDPTCPRLLFAATPHSFDSIECRPGDPEPPLYPETRSRPHVTVTEDGVYITCEHGEVVSWTIDEVREDHTVALVIVNAVKSAYTDGIRAIRRRINHPLPCGCGIADEKSDPDYL